MNDDLEVRECSRCPALCDSRTRIVNGVGPQDAEIVFVGEGPGADEDAQGEPFVGRSGDILTEALRAHEVSRSDVRITNCVRCRPPDNRDPTTQELENCKEYLAVELKTIDPELIVTLGKVPSQHLLDRTVAVTEEAGTLYTVHLHTGSWPVLISVHPAAILYDRSQEATLTATLEEAAAYIGDASSGQSRLTDY